MSYTDKGGYLFISNTKLSRIMMEAHLGRELTSDEIVHHIDGDTFNDSIENLQIVSKEEHNRIHHTGKHYMLGRTLPKETVEKMIKARTGLKRSEETKKRMSEAAYKREEQRRKHD